MLIGIIQTLANSALYFVWTLLIHAKEDFSVFLKTILEIEFSVHIEWRFIFQEGLYSLPIRPQKF